ncbi:MAG: tetratricopeptide repeat protein [Azospirillaceae bacterium]
MKTRTMVMRTVAPVLATLALGACATDQAAVEEVLDPRKPELTDSAHAPTLVRLGDYTMARGDTASAVTMYRKAHETDPGDPEPLIRLGKALARLGSYEEAAGAYRSALSLTPGDEDALRGMANAEIALGRPQEALPSLERAVERADRDPEVRIDPLLRNSYGVALDHLGRHGEAQEQYRRALTSRPNDLDLRTNLALSQALEGRFDQAVAGMREVATAPGATPKHRQNLALVLGLAGRTDQAAEVARVDADDATVNRNLAFFADLREIPDSGRRAAAIGEGVL